MPPSLKRRGLRAHLPTKRQGLLGAHRVEKTPPVSQRLRVQIQPSTGSSCKLRWPAEETRRSRVAVGFAW